MLNLVKVRKNLSSKLPPRFLMRFSPISYILQRPKTKNLGNYESLLIHFPDFIFFVSDDMQDISKGLSTFGAEIIKLKEINSYVKSGTGLIVFDEFARGTNPKEGQKFVRALAKYLNEKSSISIITTHFDSVVENNMKNIVATLVLVAIYSLNLFSYFIFAILKLPVI